MLLNKEIKERAKQKLKGNFGEIILAIVIFIIINFAISAIFGVFQFIIEFLKMTIKDSILVTIFAEVSGTLCSLLIILLTAFLTLGLIKYFLNFVQHKKSDISLIFQQHRLWFKAFCVRFLENFYLFLWCFVPIFVCIILSIFFSTILTDVTLVFFIIVCCFSIVLLIINRQIAYSLDFFVLAKNSHFSANQVITESVRLTKNKKWQIARLFFSTMLLPLIITLLFMLSTILITIKAQKLPEDSIVMMIAIYTSLALISGLLIFASLFYCVPVFLVSLTIFFEDVSNGLSKSESQTTDNPAKESQNNFSENVECSTENSEIESQSQPIKASLMEEREVKNITQQNREKW